MADMKTLTINGQTFAVVDETARSAAAAAQTTANGKEASGTAASAVNAHNSDTSAHSDIRTALNKKANDFSIEIYNGTSGNPKPVKFATFNYSSCGSENGISAKISMVSGHGNGTSYVFLQDAIINVNHTGGVTVDNFKYYGASTGTYDGANRQYGDIFWVIDTTNKVVDFYCLMGQYARVYQTPWKRLTYSSGGTVTQHTSCTVYSSGTMVWANNSDIALMSDIPTSMTPTAHNQAASTITAGTLAGQVVANASAAATIGTAQVRNVYAGTSDMTAGSTSLTTGMIYFVYE